MTSRRPSQLRAASPARLFNRLAAAVLTALCLSLAPGHIAPLGAAQAIATDVYGPSPLAFDPTTQDPHDDDACDASDAAPQGPELLRRVTHTRARARGEIVLAGAYSAPGARLVRMRVTAYCPCDICCGPEAAGITASGRTVSADNGRFVAADPALKFGTRLLVPGYNAGRPVRVLDRGGAIKGRSLDVYFDDHDRALEWGVRYLPVAILAAR